MKMQIVAAVLSARGPLAAKGATASPSTTRATSAAIHRPRGGSPESRVRIMGSGRSASRGGVEARRPPQEDRDHHEDVRDERHLRGEEPRVVGDERRDFGFY